MEYLLKSSAILGLFYIFYQLFLKQETFFQSIRLYFVTGIISAIAIPFIVIRKYVIIPTFTLPANVTFENTTTLATKSFDWLSLLTILYGIGIVFFSIRFLAQLSSLLWLLSTHKKERDGRYILVSTTKNIAPFSFFNYIVYNGNQFSSTELEQILIHEKVHVDQYHSFDILASQIIVIFQWFNPFIWLFHKVIQNNLEFIADAGTLKNYNQKKEYQYLLLKTTSPNFQTFITTNFYDSILKKRLAMTQKEPSKKANQLKIALLIPILIAFVFTFNTKVIAQITQPKIFEIQSSSSTEIITKDFQKTDFESLKERLEKSEIEFKYSQLKYNSNNEIIGIKISAQNKNGSSSSISQSGSNPIKPIQLTYNNDTGSLSLNNISSDVDWVSDNGDSYVFAVAKNGKTKIINANGDITEITNDDNSDQNNILVIKNSDSVKSDNINFIKIKQSDTVIFDESEEKSEETSQSVNKKNIEVHRFSDAQPMVILDGDEIAYAILKTMDPNSIASISVLKDEKATTKYGEKAKEGVIEITSKNLNKTEIKDSLLILDGQETSKKMEDIDPETIESVNVLKKEKATEKYGEKATNGVVEITLKEKEKQKPIRLNSENVMNVKDPLYVLDNIIISKEEFGKIDPETIEKMNVLKGEAAIKIYDEKGKNGVIEITTKKK